MGSTLVLFVLAASLAAPSTELSDTGAAVRLRHESVDAGETSADALTLRAAAFGAMEPYEAITIFGEVEAITVLSGNFDDGEGPPNGRPVIPDPAALNLNQAFIEGRSGQTAAVRVGRQRINLGEQRFVGAVAFRQNDQVLDAVRGLVTLPMGIGVDATRVLAVNRPLGPRDQDDQLDGNATLLRVEKATPLGQIIGFRYDLDLKEDDMTARVAGAQSVTLGAEWRGQMGRDGRGLAWSGVLAQQENETSRTKSPYGKAEGTLLLERMEISMRYERLGGGEEAFQTPLGTNRAFQGFADLFLVTPDDGIEDLSIGWRLRLGQFGPIRGLRFDGRVHRFEATETADDYGDELDLTLSWRTKRATFSMERGAYRAEDFGDDTTRWWFTAGMNF
ncbi:MAG: hypothetical protein AAGA39_03415 [Pseudomonadota bacterium]